MSDALMSVPRFDAEGAGRGTRFEILDLEALGDIPTRLTDRKQQALLRLAKRVPASAASLDEALRMVMRETCQVLGWPVARAFPYGHDSAGNGSIAPPSNGSNGGAGSNGGGPGAGKGVLEALDPRLSEDIWHVEHPADFGSFPEQANGRLKVNTAVRITAIADLDDSPTKQAAIANGLSSAAVIPVYAEQRLVAGVEFYVAEEVRETVELRDLLELLGSQLSQVASRERLRKAVRTAARHARDKLAELERVRAESRLFNDRTGLPEVPVLEDRIHQAIRRRRRSPKELFAVMAVEIQGLDRIAGTDENSASKRAEVMLTLARRLDSHLRPVDTVAHVGSERLAVLLEGVRTVPEALHIARRTRVELQRPLGSGWSHLSLDAVIGVVIGGNAYEEPAPILEDAQVALKRAREEDARVQLFDAADMELEEQRKLLEYHLGAALQADQLFLEYQPIVSLDDGSLVGLEALVRWRHPEFGLMAPEDFIPVADGSPLLDDIGTWVLNAACEQARRWQDRLAPTLPPPLTVNVPARQFFHEEFVNRLRGLLERHAITGNQIRLDVREAELMRHPSRVGDVLGRLQEIDVAVAVDDFGTGYSSLSLLHGMPVSALKIDRPFVNKPREQLRKWSVAHTIVELGRLIKVDVIAEGIETRAQSRYLRSIGCTQAQGFYFCRPLGPAEAEAMIRDGHPVDLEAAK